MQNCEIQTATKENCCVVATGCCCLPKTIELSFYDIRDELQLNMWFHLPSLISISLYSLQYDLKNNKYLQKVSNLLTAYS